MTVTGNRSIRGPLPDSGRGFLFSKSELHEVAIPMCFRQIFSIMKMKYEMSICGYGCAEPDQIVPTPNRAL
jgi:hypothetical protein